MIKRKNNINIMLLCIVTFLISFGLSFSISSLAKYAVKLSDVSNSATLAKWEVTASIPSQTFNLLTDQNPITYTFNVTNNSEVAAIYSIELDNIPYGVFVKLDNSSYVARNDSSHTIKINNIGTINANASSRTKTHTLTFIASPDADEIDNNISIKVSFRQKNVQ